LDLLCSRGACVLKLRRMSSSSTGEELLLLAGMPLHLLPASRAPGDVGRVLRV
jgi:hypothetical protein